MDALRLYLRPRLIAVMLLGIASGTPLPLTFGTLSAWLQQSEVSLETIGLFAALGVPYTLKFLWAPLMDAVQLPGFRRLGKRRGWLLFWQIGLALSVVGLAFSQPGQTPWLTALFAFLLAVMSASQDVVMDAYRVEILKPEEYGAGSAMVVFGYRLGMVISGGGALVLAAYLDWTLVFLAMLPPMLLASLVALWIGEPEHPAEAAGDTENRSMPGALARGLKRARWPMLGLLAVWGLAIVLLSHSEFKEKNSLLLYVEGFAVLTVILGGILWLLPAREGARLSPAQGWMLDRLVSPFADFAERQGWKLILLFILLFKLGDALAGVMTTPFLLDIGFTTEQIGLVVKSYGLAATLAGAAVGGWLVKRLGLLGAIWVGGIGQMATNLAFVVQAKLGAVMPALFATITLENFFGGLGTTAFVAFLSALCNLRFTATQYALLSSLAAVGRTLFAASSGFLAGGLGWAGFFLLTSAAAAPGILLLLPLRKYVKGLADLSPR